MKKISKILSIFLVLALVANISPRVFAAEVPDPPAIMDSDKKTTATIKDEAKILGELTDKREENVKQYLMGDMTYQAVVYPEAVHYKDNGKWQDIDNTLSEVEDSTVDTAKTIDDTTTGNVAPTTDAKPAPAATDKVAPTTDAKQAPAATDKVAPTTDAKQAPATTDKVVPATDDKTTPTLNSNASASVSKDNNKVFTNKKNSFNISIAKKSDSSKLVSIKKDKYEINWSLDKTNKVKGEVEKLDTEKINSDIEKSVEQQLTKTPDINKKENADKKEKNKKTKIENEKKKLVANNSSTVDFKNAFDNVDLQYNTIGEKVKENIIINQKSNISEFTFILNVKNLVPELQKDNSINFLDKDNKKNIVYSVMAPYMVDAKKEINNKVSIKLEPYKNKYKMTVTLDKEWLNSSDRAYPVVVDPTVVTSQNVNDIRDTFVASSDATNRWVDPYLRVGPTESYGVCRSFIQFTVPSNLTPATTVTSAQLYLSLQGVGGTSQVDIHKLTKDVAFYGLNWSNSQSIFDPKIEEFLNLNNSSPSTQYCDITSMVKQWTTTGINYGLMLQNHNESTSSSAYASSDYSAQGIRPCVAIYYIDNSGLESYWTYHSQPVGRGGTGYTNDYNGNLVYIHDDYSGTGSRMPVTIKHVFNSNDKTTDIGYGPGWRLNLSQRIAAKSLSGQSYYEYIDEDGTRHYFTIQNGAWKDEAGLGYTLTLNADGTFTIVDKKSNKLVFTASGYIWKIIDSNGNQQTLSYNGATLTTVTDGSGRVTTLNVLSNGYLVGIADPSGKTTKFGYNGAQLNQITYPDNNTTYFTYDSRSNMATAQNYDGYKISYSYYDVFPYRVKNAVESNGSTLGQELNINYGFNTTTFTDVKGRKSTYQFNSAGNTISEKDNDGNASYYTFNDSPNISKMSSSSKTQKVNVNYVKNHNAEYDSNWSFTNDNSSAATGSFSTAEKYIGQRSLSVTKTNTSARSEYQQYLTLQKGNTYTYSGYIKTSGITNVNGQGANLLVHYKNSAGAWLETHSSYVSGTNDWTRYEVTFTVPADASSGDVIIRTAVSGETGTAYFDCLQLEDGSIANRYNLVENSDFNFDTGMPVFWSGNSACDSNDTQVNVEGRNTFRMNGVGTASKNISQVIQVSGDANSSLVLSGWAKGQTVPLSSGRYFALDVGFVAQSDGKINQWEVVQFNQDSTDWQYAAKKLVANYAYKSLIIYAIYYNNANTVYFDNLQLYKEEFGQSYLYDENGNVQTTIDLAKQKSEFQYNGTNDLIAATDAKGGKFNYTYDGKHNVSTATTAENVAYSFTYDNSGNALTSKIGDSTLFMQSSAAYTSSGNYVKSLTDSSGNTTVNNWDENTGNLTSNVDAKGNFTNYSYDTLNRLTSVARTGSGTNVENFPLNSSTVGSNGTKTVSENACYEVDPTLGRSCFGVYEPTANQIINNSFESGTNSWITSDWSNLSGRARLVNDGINESNCLEFYDSDGLVNGSGTNSVAYQYINFSSPLTTATTYTLSAYAKKIGGSQPVLGVDCYDANGREITNGYLNYTKTINDNQWTRISQSFTIPAGTKQFMPIVRCSVKDKDLVRFDAVQLEGKAYASPYTNGATSGTNLLYNLGVSKLSGTEAFWFNSKGNGVRQIIANEGTNQEILNIYTDANNVMKIAIRKQDGTWVDIITASDMPISSNTWYFTALRWSTNNGVLSCVLTINNKSYSATSNDFKDFSGGKTGVGNSVPGLYQLDGLIEQFNYTAKCLSDADINAMYAKTFTNVAGKTYNNTYSYTNDKISSIIQNGSSYNFGYDVLGNNTTVAIGNQNLITNNYEARSSILTSSTYGNGNIVGQDYDGSDRIISKKYQANATAPVEYRYGYQYDNTGNLGLKTDNVNGVTTKYYYDLANRLANITDTKGNATAFKFDDNNNMSNIDDTVGGTKYSTAYNYDKDNKLKTISYNRNSNNTITNNYDGIGRLNNKVVNTGAASYTTSYTYSAGINGSTTAKVSTINNNGKLIGYAYDANGNISSIIENEQQSKFYYDELNELIREDSINLNKTIIYTYDNSGNLLTKSSYPYTNGVVSGTPTVISYQYGDGNWKDKLTSYNGAGITYDAIGNPLTYNGWTYGWEAGRQLKTLTGNGNTISYKYDDSGIRTQKVVNGVTTNYHLVGDKVTYEDNGTDKIYYTYDSSDDLVSMNLNGVEYYYIRNAQGDITGLFDGSGAQVVTYTYDSWGKIISTTGTLASTVGAKNPYRYRGYRYDTETGMYYLQSRYYSPEWGRFINADALGGSLGKLLSHNIFAYCSNNPISKFDPTGYVELMDMGEGGAALGEFDECTNPFDNAAEQAEEFKERTSTYDEDISLKEEIKESKAENKSLRTNEAKGTKVNKGQQDKHIQGTNNYKQELANGKPRSILYKNPQKLLDEFAGKGQRIGVNKERVDFGETIGRYYDKDTEIYFDTAKGIIHYNSKGEAHIVPSRP